MQYELVYATLTLQYAHKNYDEFIALFIQYYKRAPLLYKLRLVRALLAEWYDSAIIDECVLVT